MPDGTVLHDDRLYTAFNKYYRAMTEYEFWEEMDIPMTNNAIQVCNFPKEITEWIFEKPKKPFSTGGKLRAE